VSIRLLCALLAAGFAMAQEQQQPLGQKATQQNPDDQQAQDQTYQGPSILSRDSSLLSEPGGKLGDFRVYAEVTGIYDTGLVPLVTNAQGSLVSVGAAYGVETGFGVIGSRTWKRDRLSIEYKGAYRQYSVNDVVQGLDQFLNLRYSHAMKRRMFLDLKETVGSVANTNGSFAYLPLTNNDLFAIPANELFDIRTRFAQSRIDLTFQKTDRLSFSVGGEGYVVRRSSLLLAGLDGYDAHANVAYRLTRHQTVSANYNHTYFDFQQAFGNSTLQSVSLGYSLGLSRRWDLKLRAGGLKIDQLGVMQVAIPPAIAEIVGQNFANVTFRATTYVPLEEASLEGHFERSSLKLSYLVGASPGNGVYLTSRQTSGTVGYSYTGYRRLALGLHGGYNELSAVGQNLGQYTNLQGGTGITYKIARETHLELRYDYRHYTTQNNIYQKDSSRVSLGLAFSPGEAPLAIW